jgi:uncharacterized protein YjbJ (UPF0337 family)
MRMTPRITENGMNSNEIKGTAKDIAGKAQEKFGEATGSTEQQVKGTAKQVEGNVQKGVGRVQHAAEDAATESDKQRDKQQR